MSRSDEIRARLEGYTGLRSESIRDYHDAWCNLVEYAIEDIAYLLERLQRADELINKALRVYDEELLYELAAEARAFLGEGQQ